MITALLQLDHRIAAIAFLPPFLLCRFCKLLRGWVFWAISRFVHLLTANTTDLGLTTWTTSDLSSFIHTHMFGLNPFSTFSTWAIYPVLSLKLFELFVIVLFELSIKKNIHVLETYGLIFTASRWHMRRVCD